MTYEALQQQIRAGQFAPVYCFFGEEQFFIDRLADLLERQVMAGSEPSFNLDVLYGNECTAAQIVGAARSFPMMAERRMCIVKDSQKLRKEEMEKLVGYLEKPSPSTVLLFVHRDKKLPDQRSKFGKALSKTLVFESKPLYEDKVPAWIEKQLQAEGIGIDPDAKQIMAASLGNNLQLIANEIEKIALKLHDQPRKHISRQLVYEMINIDKDFNVFELVNVVGAGNAYEAHLILDQMLRNAKSNPPILIIAQLHKFFVQLAQLQQGRVQGERAIAETLGIPPFFAKNYVAAQRRYGYGQCLQALQALQQADMALKGISTTRMPETHILKTLLHQMLAA